MAGAITLRCGRSKCTISARLAGRPVLSATLSPASVETSTCASALSAPAAWLYWANCHHAPWHAFCSRQRQARDWMHCKGHESNPDPMMQALILSHVALISALLIQDSAVSAMTNLLRQDDDLWYFSTCC